MKHIFLIITFIVFNGTTLEAMIKMMERIEFTTPSYSSCTSNHHMIYNTSDLITLLNILHRPYREPNEVIQLGILLDAHVEYELCRLKAEYLQDELRELEAEQHIRTRRKQFEQFQSRENS